MRVVQVVPFASPRFGGPSAVASAYAEHLLGLGVDIRTVTTVGVGELAEFRDSELFRSSYGSGRLICLQRCWPHRWFNGRRLRSTLTEEIHKADICHLQMLWDRPHVLAARYTKKAVCPYIITPHGLLEPWRLSQKKNKKRIFMKLIGHGILRRASCLHALCEEEVQSFRDAGYRGPLSVVPNGVDSNLLDQGGSATTQDHDEWPEFENRRITLFLSRLAPEKGLDALLKAWNEVCLKERDALLVIAGPNNRGYGLVVRQMVCDMGLSRSVRLLGPIYGKRKLSLLRLATVFVLPSYSEGFSMALLEALAIGIPCLITPGCNFPEAYEYGAAILAQPNASSISGGLTFLLGLSNKELKLMGKAGNNLVREKYTWHVSARKMLTVYSRIVQRQEVPLYPEPHPLD